MSSKFIASPAALIVPVTFGLLVLAREFFIQATQHSVEGAAVVFFWCALPFAVAAMIGVYPNLRAIAVGMASATLITTLYSHYVFFVEPGQTSDRLGLIFLPAFNLFLIGPAGGLIAWLIVRFRRG
ncbi:MAG: hypothetical protein JNM79_20500 [Burkholderiales bacterium]|nr:hypothetical protein [Burkholderiales bacterium]